MVQYLNLVYMCLFISCYIFFCLTLASRPQGQEGLLEHRGPKVYKVTKESQAHQGPKAGHRVLDPQVSQDHQAIMVSRALQVRCTDIPSQVILL